MWTIDKFVNLDHAAAVFKKFYKVDSLTTNLAYGVAAVQSLLVVAFALDPWTYPHLLFFAAIPMLSACIALFLLRQHDTISIDGMRKS